MMNLAPIARNARNIRKYLHRREDFWPNTSSPGADVSFEESSGALMGREFPLDMLLNEPGYLQAFEGLAVPTRAAQCPDDYRRRRRAESASPFRTWTYTNVCGRSARRSAAQRPYQPARFF